MSTHVEYGSQLASRCLLCYEGRSCTNSLVDVGGNDFYSQLNAVFTLRNVLEVPEEEVSRYLQRLGGTHTPDKWIWTCCSCSGIIGQARKLHDEIVKTQRKFAIVKKRIIGAVKGSVMLEGATGNTTEGDIVTAESRRFVFSHNYEIPMDDPFNEGDRRARELEENMIQTNTGINAKSPCDQAPHSVKNQGEDETTPDNFDIENFNADSIFQLVCEPEETKISTVISDSAVVVDDIKAFVGEDGQDKVLGGTPYEEEETRMPHNSNNGNSPRINRIVARTSPKTTKKASTPDKKNLQCLFCLKMYSRPYKLEEHINSHVENKPYMCTVLECQREFSSRNVYIIHMNTHDPNRTRYPCSCGNIYASKKHLQRHRLRAIHNGGIGKNKMAL